MRVAFGCGAKLAIYSIKVSVNSIAVVFILQHRHDSLGSHKLDDYHVNSLTQSLLMHEIA